MRFGGLTAVSDVSFDLPEGQILGLIGPNGAGKTTLFNCINGVYPVSGGSVTFRDRKITGLPTYRVADLGLARTHQIVRPLNELTVRENVMVGACFGRENHGLGEAGRIADEVMGFVLLLALRRAGVDVNVFLKRAIGVIVLVVLGLSEVMRRVKSGDDEVHVVRWLAPVLGLLGGVMTMLANAAGPIFACYMLALSLPKRTFMGTAAWLFFILNMIKVPFHAALGNITVSTLIFDLKMIPAIGVGAGLGILLFRVIPEKGFRVLVYALTVIACVKLLCS